MKVTDTDWVAPVISFLSANMPRTTVGWDHDFMTAYQIGCEALVALGEATETIEGAIRRKVPERPQKLPRWDDICIAILSLANQQNKLSYCVMEGSKAPQDRHVRAIDAPPPSPPNILPAHGLGPARAGEEVLSVLTALGLIGADGHWTEQAELVLWRDQPLEWSMDVTSDHRFLRAVQNAFGGIPTDLRKKIDRLVSITKEDVEADIRRHDAGIEAERAKYGPGVQIAAPMTTERAEESLRFRRRDQLDWIFFRRWRLREGWLTTGQAAHALEIFHDPLATQMRRAVLSRLHPKLPYFAE
ncbi:hypothetical protein [Rhizobium sp. RU36D]|uniref:hypothetical protein n=1 Tax=Rhizobium sp. RU36D TaxID=1907415 RepID=UPI0009D7F037|nr:hypothetical protein [Rhizobium sp. RU36D]SMC82801.1 hypothetical protein SAMN05880593_107242 [Rhizobium sp. RU36D]